MKGFLITHYVCLLALLGLLQTNEANHLRLDDLAFKKEGKKEKKRIKTGIGNNGCIGLLYPI